MYAWFSLLSIAHMLPAPVPDCFQRNRVVSVRAALGSGMDILVHLQKYDIQVAGTVNTLMQLHTWRYRDLPAVVVR